MACINNLKVNFNPGETILEVANRYNIIIPTLCAGEFKTSTCRICLVKVGDDLVTACDTQMADEMNILTVGSEVLSARKLQLELILADHDTNCLTCLKNDYCQLQKLAKI